jgi:LmbE family N-acetylglucosaminyl deacetylase
MRRGPRRGAHAPPELGQRLARMSRATRRPLMGSRLAIASRLLPLALLACAGSGAPGASPVSSSTGASVVRPRDGTLWVLAPHPDDEALFGAEPIRRALREARDVRVMVMTNGDLGCERDGYLRERETIAAMAELGLPEDHVRFLGYPDGYLDALATEPLPARARRLADGTCGAGASTYASRGEAGRDVHTQLHGDAATYTIANAVGDLVALLERDRPSDVYVAHPIDEHPDHATTYVLLRLALEASRLEALPRVHRALVHVGGCWPNGERPTEPCAAITGELGTPYPPLPSPLDRYRASERLIVDDGGAQARRAIAHYGSQLHVEVEHDWLGTFARGEAIAWPETLVREGPRIVRARAEGVAPGVAEVIAGAVSSDVEGARRIQLAVHHRAPIEVRVEAELEAGGTVVIELDRRGARPLRVVIGVDAIRFARGEERVRDVFVPEAEGAHAWSLRVDPRPDDGGVIELELRRDARPVAWAVVVDEAIEGDAVRVMARGASLETSAARARTDGASESLRVTPF